MFPKYTHNLPRHTSPICLRIYVCMLIELNPLPKKSARIYGRLNLAWSPKFVLAVKLLICHWGKALSKIANFMEMVSFGSSHDQTHIISHNMRHNFLLEATFWQLPFLLIVTALVLWLKLSFMVALSFNYLLALIPKTTKTQKRDGKYWIID